MGRDGEKGIGEAKGTSRGGDKDLGMGKGR